MFQIIVLISVPVPAQYRYNVQHKFPFCSIVKQNTGNGAIRVRSYKDPNPYMTIGNKNYRYRNNTADQHKD
jgi:hypothetical protein